MTTIRLLLASLVLVVALQATCAADSTPFTQCPAIGFSTSCEALITVNPDGSATVQLDPAVSPLDGPIEDAGEDVLVGVQNNSSLPLLSLTLSGDELFGFDGDGLCTYSGNPFSNPPIVPAPSFCSNPGPTGYEGPNNTFSFSNENNGQVVFTIPIAPGGSAYFSLEGVPQIFSATANFTPTSDVPEPASLVLLGTGLIAGITRFRRGFGG